MEKSALGRWLERQYVENGYNRQDFANIAGVTEETVLQWENGSKEPDVKEFRKLAAFFNESYERFLDESHLPDMWRVADTLGLSDGTIRLLEDFARNAPGNALDELDEAVAGMVKKFRGDIDPEA